MSRLLQVKGLTVDRLKWYHGQFLEAAQRFPRFYHTFAWFHDPKVDKALNWSESTSKEPNPFPTEEGYKSRFYVLDFCTEQIGAGGPFNPTGLSAFCHDVAGKLRWSCYWDSNEKPIAREAVRWLIDMESRMVPAISGVETTSWDAWADRVYDLLPFHENVITNVWEYPDLTRRHLGLEFFVASAMALEVLVQRAALAYEQMAPSTTSRVEWPSDRQESDLLPLQVQLMEIITRTPGLSRREIAKQLSEAQGGTVTEDTIAKPLSELGRHKLITNHGSGYHPTSWGTRVLHFNKSKSAEEESEQ
ncbi:hypothetical protein [Planctomyces sp. SH-PL14]|uniref:hypothetical protein n=1 Tax=Planctomyces sp. SH-PL14 TaxID=1632864 RepID=UPI00078E9AC1|nr:hypothetical protein [Planctomyces sp. SH-PL14]AMV18230.1 hypothetical protein VT03_10100 [Planctomyces sp. SH-PL14]